MVWGWWFGTAKSSLKPVTVGSYKFFMRTLNLFCLYIFAFSHHYKLALYHINDGLHTYLAMCIFNISFWSFKTLIFCLKCYLMLFIQYIIFIILTNNSFSSPYSQTFTMLSDTNDIFNCHNSFKNCFAWKFILHHILFTLQVINIHQNCDLHQQYQFNTQYTSNRHWTSEITSFNFRDSQNQHRQILKLNISCVITSGFI